MAVITINLTAHGEVVCRSFYDTDLNYGGVDIKIKSEGEHLGSMIDVNLPDEADEDEVEAFADKVENWLIDNGH